MNQIPIESVDPKLFVRRINGFTGEQQLELFHNRFIMWQTVIERSIESNDRDMKGLYSLYRQTLNDMAAP